MGSIEVETMLKSLLRTDLDFTFSIFSWVHDGKCKVNKMAGERHGECHGALNVANLT